MSAWTKLKKLFAADDVSDSQNKLDQNPFQGLLTGLDSEAAAASESGFEQLTVDLSAMFGSRPAVAHERLFILTLKEVRQRLGVRWAATQRNIMKLCEAAAKRHLGAGDISIKYGSDCLVIFTRGDVRAARRRVQAVAEEVFSTIVGEDSDLVQQSLYYAIADAQNRLSFRLVDALDPLKGVLAEALPSASMTAGADPLAAFARPSGGGGGGAGGGGGDAAPQGGLVSSADGNGAVLDIFRGLEEKLLAQMANVASVDGQGQHLAHQFERLEQDIGPVAVAPTLGRQFEEALGFATDGDIGHPDEPATGRPWTAVSPNPLPGPTITSYLDKVPQVAADFDLGNFPLIKPAPRAGAAPAFPMGRAGQGLSGDLPPAMPRQIDYRFIPAWHATKQVVSAYWFELVIQQDGLNATEAEIIPPGSDPTLVALIDRVVLMSALTALRKAYLQNLRNVICIPVHHTTLNATTRLQAYLGICRSIPPEMRRYIVWELIGAPAGAWQSQLFQVIAALRPFGRAVLLRDTLEDINMGALKGLGVFGIGVDLACYQQKEAVLIRKLDKFIEKANEAGLRTFIRHCPTLSLASYAVSAGVDYIDGPMIASPVMAPLGIRRFAVRDLYMLKAG
ncbi:hypothetical protein [Oceanibaculum pacificum]|uniref:EAL domain-containing protein n=1 Tax=Oceanibaculum pacificum TaxID=580166 RepID=A0A154VAC2_9PROT|nr:hypothetical protein [Oceanibaculum pacificum]KZC98311.1 hypothetical protein AUP43_03785 [Oceanibaculum pacificum]